MRESPSLGETPPAMARRQQEACREACRSPKGHRGTLTMHYCHGEYMLPTIYSVEVTEPKPNVYSDCVVCMRPRRRAWQTCACNPAPRAGTLLLK
jgi:hypothetical protein